MSTETDEKGNAKKFLDSVADKATEMINLDIKTYIGEMTYEAGTGDKKGRAVFTDTAKIDGIQSRINLLQGDITTEMSTDFHANYQDLVKFHQAREKRGQDIIKNNIELVKSLVETISDFMNKS